MIQKGEVSQEIVDIINEVALAERFGWTPQIIREIDEKDIQEYSAVLRGWNKRDEGTK